MDVYSSVKICPIIMEHVRMMTQGNYVWSDGNACNVNAAIATRITACLPSKSQCTL